MFDHDQSADAYLGATSDTGTKPANTVALGTGFMVFKRVFDVIFGLLLLAAMAAISVILLIFNPFFNPGPLFFRQERMGQDCKPFMAFKFRSMLPADRIERGPFDRLETDRITGLGRILRKSRLDELPQVINVLKGEMSLIGPRPDYIEHAKIYVGMVPGYRQRHAVRPGISGFAQIEVGYAEGLESVHRKVAADLHYISNQSIAFEMRIAWRTMLVVLLRKGS